MKAIWQILALILVCCIIVVGSSQSAKAQASPATVNVLPTQNSIKEGQTLTVNVTVSNVQNLYAIDLTLDWNASILQIQNVNLQLGVNSQPTAHPNGVLYGNQISDSIVAGDIFVNATQTTGEYRLVATSVAPASSFNGSGAIAIFTFNVTGVGHSGLTVQSELADHPEPGESTSEPIAHTDVSGSVDAAAIPEFPEIALVTVLVALTTVTLLVSRKSFKKKASTQ